jgi:hypothetical protein
VENVCYMVWYLQVCNYTPVETVTKIQQIIYSKKVCQIVHTELCMTHCALEHWFNTFGNIVIRPKYLLACGK